MFGKKKQKKQEGGTGTMGASVQELVEALKKWKAAVEERDTLLKAEYAKSKELQGKVDTLTGEKEALIKERDTLSQEKADLQQQLDTAKKTVTDPPAAPKPD